MVLAKGISAPIAKFCFYIKIFLIFVFFKKIKFLKTFVFLYICREGALKLKQVAYIHAEAFSSGEMKHGPIAMIDST